MFYKKNKYSFLIKPLQLILDCVSIFLVLFFIADSRFYNIGFIVYTLSFWIATSFIINYYQSYRYVNVYRITSLIFKQIVIFSFGFFAYFGIFKEGEIVHNQFNVLFFLLLTTSTLKYLFFFSIKLYRIKGRNYRKAIVLGYNASSKRIIKLIKQKKSYGIRYQGYFTKKQKKGRLGNVNESFHYATQNQIDEIYCAISEFNNNEIKEITKFANTNDINLKLIPDFEQLYSKNRKPQYYDNALMVIQVDKLPFQHFENYIIKRVFDIVFSIAVLLVVYSWLYPILWVLIKLESKGPVIFKQKREGLHGEEFTCYKFRSMKINNNKEEKHASKNDPRITKIGAFIRKTSLDEMPQFINVLKGDMSVVGPRPHVKSFSKEYKQEVDLENYIKRYAMKPGITGLAQVSGYRGEVKAYSDIKNRIRMDIFYIENWSFLLDVKIILMTIFNVFKGEEKAY